MAAAQRGRPRLPALTTAGEVGCFSMSRASRQISTLCCQGGACVCVCGGGVLGRPRLYLRLAAVAHTANPHNECSVRAFVGLVSAPSAGVHASHALPWSEGHAREEALRIQPEPSNDGRPGSMLPVLSILRSGSQ